MGLNLNAQNTHKKTPTHPLTLTHTYTHAHTHTRTHAHRREIGDVRVHGSIYTNTLLHVYLAKYPACCTALDLQPRRRGHSASTRATCPKFLAWCTDMQKLPGTPPCIQERNAHSASLQFRSEGPHSTQRERATDARKFPQHVLTEMS